MKMFRSFIAILFIIAVQPQLFSQAESFGLVGEYVLADISRRVDRGSSETVHRLSYTEKTYSISTIRATLFSGVSGNDIFGFAPPEVRIISANFKSDNPDIVFILFSDATVLVLHWKYSETGDTWEYSMKDRKKIFSAASFLSLKKIVGDAVYVLAGSSIYASWDTAKTWMIDSVNIGKLTVTDVSVDTNQYGWVSTNQGVFYQHPDSAIWRKAASIPGAQQSVSAIFVDRRNRIFISRPGKIYCSTDQGVSWNDLSDGSMESIASFGDDAFGNIYAVGTGSQAYRLSELTLPWIPIADSIKNQAYLPSNAKIINSISGDTVLSAATRYGLFHSKDQGTHWTAAPDSLQLPSHNFYAGVIKGGSYYYASNNLGIYRKTDADTRWKKIFPQQGFTWGVNAIACDSAGNVYGNFPLKTGPSSYSFFIVRSTDHGTSWSTDTAGFKALGIFSGTQTFDHFVTKQGVQYLGGSGILYSKYPGQVWKKDTNGIGMKPGEYIADVSLNNKKGITYLGRRAGGFPTYSFALYQRVIGDSVWHTVNTSTLATSEGRLVSDQNGDIIIRTLSGAYKVWRYNAAAWTEILLPTGIGGTPFIGPMTVDGNGAIWGAFFAGGNKGVYCTTNNGSTWKYVGLNTVGIKFLTAVEDSLSPFMKLSGSPSSAVYAVTIIDGIHRFTTASEPPTRVEDGAPTVAESYQLLQNYPNPFNPVTTIAYTIPIRTLVTVVIFDILGREVRALVNEEMNAGEYSVQFNASGLSSGIYFYRMQAGKYTSVKKLLLQK